MLRLMRKFLRLPFARKALLIQVSLQLLLIRAGLSLFPFARIYGWIKRFHRLSQPRVMISDALESIPWAVNLAGKVWFGDEGCLPQAILGECLLIRKGYPAKMTIGVRRQPDGTLIAHAWVECNGQNLIGGTTNHHLNQFKSFPDFTELIS